MSLSSIQSNTLAADARSLNSLKMQAGQNDPAAIKETAKQFESLFMRELIKSMREATVKSGLLDSSAGDLSSDLLDQQLAVQMSGQPGGLSEAIARQLARQMGVEPGATAAAGTASTVSLGVNAAAAASASSAASAGKAVKVNSNQAGFVQRLGEVASKVEASSGIPAAFMIGQAGHETGWGKFEIKMKGGAPSYNLFGIKAGAGWTGKVAEITTTEYVNGEARKTVAKFRAYDSYEESFRDYARLINENPRYAQARQQTGSVQGFASSLQKAGYATDPQYATKLAQAINSTLRLQRAV